MAWESVVTDRLRTGHDDVVDLPGRNLRAVGDFLHYGLGGESGDSFGGELGLADGEHCFDEIEVRTIQGQSFTETEPRSIEHQQQSA
jgi:hypothetical protein